MKRMYLVAAATGLDALVGDPVGIPHPVRGIGEIVARGEEWLRTGITADAEPECIGGAALAVGTIAIAAAIGYVAQCLSAFEIPLAASTLALRNLIDESEAVAAALESLDLDHARTAVARIVGRDTAALDESEIARATIETLAESLCDGVIAPLVYLTIAGTPGALAYKAINTLDSMIGHIEPPYRYFGRFAARLDDAANWVPARITAACIIGAAVLADGCALGSLAIARRDGALSSSPNAGQTEAAMAGALGVCLGGVNTYDGLTVIGATFGMEFDRPQRKDIRRAQRITIVAASLAYGLAMAVAWYIDER